MLRPRFAAHGLAVLVLGLRGQIAVVVIHAVAAVGGVGIEVHQLALLQQHGVGAFAAAVFVEILHQIKLAGAFGQQFAVVAAFGRAALGFKVGIKKGDDLLFADV